MQVIRITPRGYCYGVVDAMTMVRRAAQDPAMPRPIHVLGLIVHNRHAVAELDKWGVVHLDGPERLGLLEQVPSGTVIFTAHGVSPAVKERARREHRSAGEVLSDLARQALTASTQGAGRARYGFKPLPHRGVTVSNALIDRLREDELV